MSSEGLVQIIVVLVDLVVGLLIGFRLSKGKSKKRNMIWGISTMFVIAPLLSFLVSLLIAYMISDGWTGIALFVIVFPLFFFVGLGMLVRGVFNKS